MAVRDRGRVGAAWVVEDRAPGLHREAGGRGAFELGRVDDVADRGQRADHRPARRLDPARFAALRVERVDVAVEGADVDGRAGVPGPRDRRARVGVAAGRVAPGELAVGDVEAVDPRVVVAGVDPAEGDRRGRVELAGAAEARPEAAALPFELAGLGVDGVHVAAVVADVEVAPVVGGRRLDRAAERRRPAHVAVAGAERVEVAVLAAEVDGAVDDQRRGLRPAGQRPFPDRPARPRVELDDVPGDEVDDVEALAVVGRRRGVEAADPPLPELPAGVGVERDRVAAVVDEEEPAGGDDGRELEQRAGRCSARRPGTAA